MQTSDHFKSASLIVKCPDNLFTRRTRPTYVKSAYEEAALTPVHVFKSLDTYRRDGRIGSHYFFCQPVFTDPLIKKLKRIKNLDIELEKVSELFSLQLSVSSSSLFFDHLSAQTRHDLFARVLQFVSAEIAFTAIY